MNIFRQLLGKGALSVALTASIALAGVVSPSALLAQGQPVNPTVPAQSPSVLGLTVGFGNVLRVEGEVGTIAVGSPNVADASPLDAKTILLTGLAAGVTNMIVLSEGGEVLADYMLHVSSRQPGTVTVRRGLVSQTYSCAAGLCEGIGGGDGPASIPPA